MNPGEFQRLLAKYRAGAILGSDGSEAHFDVAGFRSDLRAMADRYNRLLYIYLTLIVGIIGLCVFLVLTSGPQNELTKVLITGGASAPVFALLALMRNQWKEAGAAELMLRYAANQKDPTKIQEIVNTFYAQLTKPPSP